MKIQNPTSERETIELASLKNLKEIQIIQKDQNC
jgi:hypothetical protein